MEEIANAKIASLYAISSGMRDDAKSIKESATLLPGESRRLCNIHLKSTAENMYVGYSIYRRLIDSTYCILVVRMNGDFLYYDEV